MKIIRKRKTIYNILIIFMVFVVLLLIELSKLQDDLFFHPWNDLVSYEKLQKNDEFKEIKIKNNEVNLSGWFWNIQNKVEKAPLVIYFGGNNQNSSNILYKYYESEIMKDVFGDYNLMMIDYPGYGMSKGKPSDESMFIASSYVFEYATKMNEVDKDNIVIMGYSIGTGVATYCASQNKANGLILVAPYDKALSLYNDVVDIFHGPIQSFAKYKFDSATFAEKVKEPTLIITSKNDEVIAYKHSMDLSSYFSKLDNIVVLDGINHGGYFDETQVLNYITDFLNKKIQ